MTPNMMRPAGESPHAVFKEEDMPSRGFIAQLLSLLTEPARFFQMLGTRNGTKGTLWAAILILAMLAFNALQMPIAGGNSQPVVDAMPFAGMPGEGMPFEPGFPPDGGGAPAPANSDPTEKWMTALTAVGAQVVQWLVLSLLLSEVTLLNGYRPHLRTTFKIAIWASVPLALMAALQALFMMGGGTISAAGFSGFLLDWPRFTELDIYVQSFIHALASQLTLFWLWSLALVYLGARYALRGKKPVVIMIVSLWVLMLGMAYSFQSYEMLYSSTPVSQEWLPEGEFPLDEGFLTDDSGMMPEESIITDVEGKAPAPIEQVESVEGGQ